MSSLLIDLASETIFGSAERTPLVCLTSITSSASKLSASTKAVVSLPPLPRQVILPFGFFPTKPQTTGTTSPNNGAMNFLASSDVFFISGLAFWKLESVINGQLLLHGSKSSAFTPWVLKAEQKKRALIRSPMDMSSA